MIKLILILLLNLSVSANENLNNSFMKKEIKNKIQHYFENHLEINHVKERLDFIANSITYNINLTNDINLEIINYVQRTEDSSELKHLMRIYFPDGDISAREIMSDNDIKELVIKFSSKIKGLKKANKKSNITKLYNHLKSN